MGEHAIEASAQRFGRLACRSGQRTSDARHLDGNAAGGVLGQISAVEMTTAQVVCASCGNDWPIGGTAVYATAMGTIIRCPGCGEALIRLAHGPQRSWVDFSGTRLMQIRAFPRWFAWSVATDVVRAVTQGMPRE